jgi:hypothetical protein
MGKQLDKVAGRRYPPDNIRLEKAGQDSHTCRGQWHVVADDPADRNAASSNPLPEPVSEGSAAFAAFARTNAWGKDSADDSSLESGVEQTRQTLQQADKPALQADSDCRVSNANAASDDGRDPFAPDPDEAGPTGEDW